MQQPSSYTLTGTVIDVKGEPFPHSFWIQGEDQNIYFSRLGDIKKNEEIFFNKKHKTEYLEKNDKVKFNPFNKNSTDHIENSNSLRAINVEKINE